MPLSEGMNSTPSARLLFRADPLAQTLQRCMDLLVNPREYACVAGDTT